MNGSPLQIVNLTDDHGLILVEQNLVNILDQPCVKDKAVVVVSLAGAFRKGKSFLLNFFLKYLTHYTKHGNDTRWLTSDEIPLSGFHWQSGAERATSGILMWSKPFLLTNRNTGHEVAVLLMDTQGVFDTKTSMNQSAGIFAMSTLLSSFQIYNIGDSNIGEHDLQHLQLFTEYAKVSEPITSSHLFQSLLFLVRDWRYEFERPYGFEGGANFLRHRLSVSCEENPELNVVCCELHRCFDSLTCFLMPHPGQVVAGGHAKSRHISISDIDPTFIKYVGILVPKILSPENLLIKKISGNPVTCHDLLLYCKVSLRRLSDNSMPKLKSVVEATALIGNLISLREAKARYQSSMDRKCGNTCQFVRPREMKKAHQESVEEAVNQFQSVIKAGGQMLSKPHLDELKQEMEKMFYQYKEINRAKNTPAWVIRLMSSIESNLPGVHGYFFGDRRTGNLLLKSETNNIVALTSARNRYRSLMETKCVSELSHEKFNEAHEWCYMKTMTELVSFREPPHLDFSPADIETLENDINSACDVFRIANLSRHEMVRDRERQATLRRMSTPILLFFYLIVSIILSVISSCLQWDYTVRMLDFAIISSIILTLAWVICKVTGARADVTSYVDSHSLALLEMIRPATFGNTEIRHAPTEVSPRPRYPGMGSGDSTVRWRTPPT